MYIIHKNTLTKFGYTLIKKSNNFHKAWSGISLRYAESIISHNKL